MEQEPTEFDGAWISIQPIGRIRPRVAPFELQERASFGGRPQRGFPSAPGLCARGP